MNLTKKFGDYFEHLSVGLGRTERKVGLVNYCNGLMLPLKQKSIEPLGGSLDSCHRSSLPHFIADFPWADESVLGRLQSCVLARMGLSKAPVVFLNADDSGTPKQGVHSVDVARQYCGYMGDTDSCQVAMSLSVATAQASLPVKYRLYPPASGAENRKRCKEADKVDHRVKTRMN